MHGFAETSADEIEEDFGRAVVKGRGNKELGLSQGVILVANRLYASSRRQRRKRFV